jgi:hypothetical protein
MAVRPLTDQERAVLAAAQAAQTGSADPDRATYGPAGGKATYRNTEQEGVKDADDHESA